MTKKQVSPPCWDRRSDLSKPYNFNTAAGDILPMCAPHIGGMLNQLRARSLSYLYRSSSVCLSGLHYCVVLSELVNGNYIVEPQYESGCRCLMARCCLAKLLARLPAVLQFIQQVLFSALHTAGSKMRSSLLLTISGRNHKNKLHTKNLEKMRKKKQISVGQL